MCLPPEPTITVLPGPARQPTAKPPFTVGDLRRAIPAHCFEHGRFARVSGRQSPRHAAHAHEG
jgi:hypothetical protein